MSERKSVVNTYSPPDSPTQSRLKVLVLAYSVSPVRGSEYSVGWNHILHLSKECELTVLYGLAGSHMGDLEEVESYVRDNGDMKNVTFVPVRPNLLARIANFPNRNGFLVYSFYLAYRVWHAQAARKARTLTTSENFDIVHYLCPIGYREPGFLWKINKPYVWGPVGGLTPMLDLDGAPRPAQARLKASLKKALNAIQLSSSRRVARAMKRANVVIAATTQNGAVIERRFGVKTQHIPENAIPDDWIRNKEDRRSESQPLNLIWIGSLDYRKSPDLLIDAMAKVKSNGWHLHILGDGPLAPEVKRDIQEKTFRGKITLHGKIPRHEVKELLSRSDLHLITSLGEATTTVLWEAMAYNVPTLTLDHSGMHDVVCNRCGVRVPATSFDRTGDALSFEVDQILDNKSRLKDLTDGVGECRNRHLWSKRSDEWLAVYRQAIDNHRHAKGDLFGDSKKNAS